MAYPINSSRRRRSSEDESDRDRDRTPNDVPFQDAFQELGEIPLDQLDNFIVPARDDKGISSHVSFNIPPYLERQIELVLHSKRFPYLRSADFWRHAAIRHLHWLISIRSSVSKHILPALDSVMDVCRDSEMKTQYEAAFMAIDRQISYCLEKGDHSEAVRLLNSVRARIEGVQDSAWSRKFKEDLNRYSHILNPDKEPPLMLEDRENRNRPTRHN